MPRMRTAAKAHELILEQDPQSEITLHYITMANKQKKKGKSPKKHQAKPNGMTYAQVLARQAMIQQAVDKAAADTTVQLQSDIHTQRAMWLMVVSIADAFGIGPMRKLGKRYDYAQEIAARILSGESPDGICGDLKTQGKGTVSTTTLYRYIDSGFIPGVTNKNLLVKAARKRKYHHVKKG